MIIEALHVSWRSTKSLDGVHEAEALPLSDEGDREGMCVTRAARKATRIACLEFFQ